MGSSKQSTAWVQLNYFCVGIGQSNRRTSASYRKLARASDYIHGLREKFFQGVRRSIPGPQILLGPPCRKIIFRPGTKLAQNFFPIFCPKLGEEQKKRSSLKFSPIFCSKNGAEQKLNAETWTLPRPLSPAPLGPGMMYPLNPPFRRPWLDIIPLFYVQSTKSIWTDVVARYHHQMVTQRMPAQLPQSVQLLKRKKFELLTLMSRREIASKKNWKK